MKKVNPEHCRKRQAASARSRPRVHHHFPSSQRNVLLCSAAEKLQEYLADTAQAINSIDFPTKTSDLDHAVKKEGLKQPPIRGFSPQLPLPNIQHRTGLPFNKNSLEADVKGAPQLQV